MVVGDLWCFSTECMNLVFLSLAMNGLLMKCFVFDENTIGVCYTFRNVQLNHITVKGRCSFLEPSIGDPWLLKVHLSPPKLAK